MKQQRKPVTFFFLICIVGCLAANNMQAQSPYFNWGVRLGLNATSITDYEVLQANNIPVNGSYINKNGYLLTVFTRFNVKRVFMQPELGWNMYRRTCLFSLPIEGSDSNYPPVNLNIHSKALNANFLTGYNIVSDYPFFFSVFAGISFIGTYQTDFLIEPEQSFPKSDLFMNYTGILGLSINIARVYFDLRYEMGIPDADLNLAHIPGFPERFQNVTIKKREAILSFSFGIMF
jgi:hypothetical protein